MDVLGFYEFVKPTPGRRTGDPLGLLGAGVKGCQHVLQAFHLRFSQG
jgi:hypothetical protein